MKRLFPSIFCLIIFIWLAGCAVLVKEPRVTIQKTSIIGIDGSGVEVEFLVGVDNPNSFDLSLLGYTYGLNIMDVPFSQGGAQDEVNFPAGLLTELRLPMKIKFVDLLEVIKRRPEADQIPYRMTALLKIKAPLGEMQVPVDKSDFFKVPEAYRADNFIRRFIQPLKGMR